MFAKALFALTNAKQPYKDKPYRQFKWNSYVFVVPLHRM